MSQGPYPGYEPHEGAPPASSGRPVSGPPGGTPPSSAPPAGGPQPPGRPDAPQPVWGDPASTGAPPSTGQASVPTYTPPPGQYGSQYSASPDQYGTPPDQYGTPPDQYGTQYGQPGQYGQPSQPGQYGQAGQPGQYVAAVDFNRQIRPILSENCFACHGPDEKQRKAKLRLDTKEGAARVVTPGKPDESELIRRTHTDVTDEAMPPRRTTRPASGPEGCGP